MVIMCGIIGLLQKEHTIDKISFNKLRDTLIHRGPDDSGTWMNDEMTVALGHRRLSFLDLSENGRQPMSNEDGSVWISFNGEIYNYLELKKTLENKGHIFRSTSDTEVIIHGYEEWDEGVLHKLKGMFAFGIWDNRNRLLFLVRDRFGIKPLYYFHSKGTFMFASELKALVSSGILNKSIDYSSFGDFFTYRYVPSPKTIWENIYKIPPANYLVYNFSSNTYKVEEYWKLRSEEQSINPSILAKNIDEILYNSINIHTRSDVPIGVFTSGGYDSSAIVYYLSRIGYTPQTFSIGFKDWPESEHKYAEIVADKFNTPHTCHIAEEDTFSLLDRMPQVYDEPIADISIIPTFLVCQVASRKVKSVMSGEGADEIFGGYTWQKDLFAHKYYKSIYHILMDIWRRAQFDMVDLYSREMAMGHFKHCHLRSMVNPDLHSGLSEDVDWFYRLNFDPNLSPLKAFQLMDIKCFMGELVLTKVDRASMANSLEVRVPFLDHELFETIFKYKEKTYFKHNVTKYMLYENIKDHLPQEIIKRKKQGFVGPDSFYVRIDKYWSILQSGKLIKDQVIDLKFVKDLVAQKDQWRLWKLAVMEKWYAEWS